MRWWLACALGLVLAACGGGGGDDGGGEVQGPPSGGVAPPPGGGGGSTGFNGSASGRVIYSGAGDAVYLLDLASGARTRIDTEMDLWPSDDGKELAGIDTSDRSAGEDRVVLLQVDSGASASFGVDRSLHGLVRLSPDRQRLAVAWADELNGESFTRPTLTVFDRQGQVLARHPGASEWAWTPGGQLMIAFGRELMLGDATGAGLQRVATLPATPLDLAVSPDGRRIAVSLPGAASDEAHVWTLAADGSGLRQLTTSASNELNPAWSPDGRWLLVRQGVSSNIQGTGACPTLYAVPADAGGTVELTVARPTGAQPLRYQEGGTAIDACPLSAAAWLR